MAERVDIIGVGVLAGAAEQALKAAQQEFASMMNTNFVTVRMAYEPRVLPAAMRKIDRTATLALQKMAKEMNSKLVKRTPIDTGLARSSWIASINQPDTSFLPKKKPYPKGGAPAGYGRNTIIRNNRIIEGLKNGDKVFVTNNQKYVAFLEYGKSGQAPSGWIRLTMIEMANKWPEAFRSVFMGSENLEATMERAGDFDED